MLASNSFEIVSSGAAAAGRHVDESASDIMATDVDDLSTGKDGSSLMYDWRNEINVSAFAMEAANSPIGTVSFGDGSTKVEILQ